MKTCGSSSWIIYKEDLVYKYLRLNQVPHSYIRPGSPMNTYYSISWLIFNEGLAYRHLWFNKVFYSYIELASPMDMYGSTSWLTPPQASSSKMLGGLPGQLRM